MLKLSTIKAVRDAKAQREERAEEEKREWQRIVDEEYGGDENLALYGPEDRYLDSCWESMYDTGDDY